MAVAPLTVIGVDADSEILAKGLREDIVDGLARQTALSVVPIRDGGALASGSHFVLEGSVRAAGQRLRLSFTMLDTAKGARVWLERYDRHKDHLLDLEDEISGSVVSVIRIRLKALEFEHLRLTRIEDLSVPDLLSKAAGYFVQSPGHYDEAAAILGLAIERAPENAMAHAMMTLCRCRAYEYSPLNIPPPRGGCRHRRTTGAEHAGFVP